MLPLMRLFFVPIVITMVGCGDPSTDSAPNANQRPASVSFSILWQTPPPEDPDLDRSIAPRAQLADCPVEKVQCTVYGDTGEALTSHTWNCSDHQGRVNDIPPGLNRKFVVFGLDENDRILFRGEATGGYDCNPGDALDVGYIEAVPFVPQLLTPADGENCRVLNPTLTWDAVVGASNYHVTVSENSDLADPVIQGESTVANYKVSGLAKTITYYAQVHAADAYGNTGEVSQIRSFTVDTLTLPDTGQTDSSFTNTEGEDADYTINPPTFTKLDEQGQALDPAATSWVMVRDETTGLIWEVKTDDGGVHDKDTTYTWDATQAQLIDPLNNNQFGGYTNWRLPTIRELHALMNFGAHNPAMDHDYFPNILNWRYWSSTTHLGTVETVRHVFMTEGTTNHRDGTETAHALAVYGGPGGGNIDQILEDNQNGTVTDNKTGLMWQKEIGTEPVIWEEALDYCNNLELAEQVDWRLPNIKELISIAAFHIRYYGIDTFYFNIPDVQGRIYWSSTSCPNPESRTSAFVVLFNHGHINLRSKTEAHHGRCVRGGQ